MGFLNGINYKNAIGIDTLCVKVLGVVFAICSGLCIGDEGPLAHMGAILGVLCCYLPFEWCKLMQNDVRKRQMIAAGAACGLSCAFGAPIGGALFSYEISKPNTFWTFNMLYQVFFATSIAVFTLSILSSLQIGAPMSMTDGGDLTFGQVGQYGQNTIFDLPAAIVLGIVSGLLGAFFIGVSVKIGAFRKKYVATPWRKVIECVLFSWITVTCFYLAIVARRDNCEPVQYDQNHAMEYTFTCKNATYNPLATLVFNTESGTLTEFFRYPQIMQVEMIQGDQYSGLIGDVTIYFFLWYFFFITTYGIAVPAGVFVPGMLIGCSLGMIYLDLLMTGFNINMMRLGGQSYLVLGAAGMLASYTRLTYSLAVIIMETTQSINLFIPVLITIMISYGVARVFNRSLYDMSIRSKTLPVLRNHMPIENRNVRVRDLIKELFDPKKGQELETIPAVCKVSRLAQVL